MAVDSALEEDEDPPAHAVSTNIVATAAIKERITRHVFSGDSWVHQVGRHIRILARLGKQTLYH